MIFWKHLAMPGETNTVQSSVVAIAREDEHQMVSRDDRVLTRPYQHDKKMYMDATSCFANLGRKLLKELLALLLDCMVSELEAVQQCMPCRGFEHRVSEQLLFLWHHGK